ncbi:MAG: hypothetical protein O8C61_05890 [Candidatus Methanoperedens sp.]|nr:hypothetical protein [Candidatus Methanoperedens sp.]
MRLKGRLELLRQKVKDEDFLSARGLGNEIPFWIFDYPLEAKLDAGIAMLSSESALDKQEKEKLGNLIRELAAYDEKLNNKVLGFIIDLDDGVAVNFAKFEGVVEGI